MSNNFSSIYRLYMESLFHPSSSSKNDILLQTIQVSFNCIPPLSFGHFLLRSRGSISKTTRPVLSFSRLVTSPYNLGFAAFTFADMSLTIYCYPMCSFLILSCLLPPLAPLNIPISAEQYFLIYLLHRFGFMVSNQYDTADLTRLYLLILWSLLESHSVQSCPLHSYF